MSSTANTKPERQPRGEAAITAYDNDDVPDPIFISLKRAALIG